MSRWWRAYDDALNNPKLQKLPGNVFKAWFNLCCLASKSDGQLPPPADVAFALRITERQAVKLIDELKGAGLVDVKGDVVSMHDWDEHQYSSDSSAERMRRYRQRHRDAKGDGDSDVTVTVQNRAESEQNRTEQSDADASRPAKPKSSKRSPKLPLPENLKLTEEWREVAREKGLNDAGIAREFEKFEAHARANDRRCADWKAAWRQWLVNAIGYDPKLVQAPAEAAPNADQLDRAWLAKLDRAARENGGKLPEHIASKAPPDTLAKWKAKRNTNGTHAPRDSADESEDPAPKETAPLFGGRA